MPEGQYKLKVKTSLGDDNSTNDSVSWDIYIGSPYPPAGHLPTNSYKFYGYKHYSSSNQKSLSVDGYNLELTYNKDSNVFTLGISGMNCSDTKALESNKIYSFCSGKIIALLELATYFNYNDTYFIEIYFGIENTTFQMRNYIKTVYRYQGIGSLSTIPDKFKAKYDYYLPSGWQNYNAYLHAYNNSDGTPIDANTLSSYIDKWSYADRDSNGSPDGSYSGSLLMGYSFTSPGVIEDYYVIVPASIMPIGDYNFIIFQERELSSNPDNTLIEKGWAHSIRMKVEAIHDISVSQIQLPTSIQSGNVFNIIVPVINKGEINESNVPLTIKIFNDNYNLTLSKIVSVSQGSTVNVSFDWDTIGLPAGIYNFQAMATIENDINLGDNNSSAQKELLPPPVLSLVARTDKSSYTEGEQISLFVNTETGAIVNYAVKNNSNSVVKTGTVSDPDNDGIYTTTFNAPILPGAYTIEVIASKVGYQNGTATINFDVKDTHPPTVPILLSPFQNSFINNSTPIFDWIDSIDTGSGVEGYELQIDDNIDFSSPIEDVIQNVSTYTPANPLSNGTYYWRVKAKDKAGNWNTQWSDIWQFEVDTVSPIDGTLTATPEDGQVTLNWDGFSDNAGSGLNTYKVVRSKDGYPPEKCISGTQIYLGSATSTTDTGLSNGTPYYYRVCAYDNAGNVSNGATASATPKSSDTTPPTCSIKINNDAQYTNTRSVTLSINASDPSGVSKMCISNTTSCSSWEGYTTTKNQTLTSGDGTKTVYAWFEDGVGNRNDNPCSDTIILDTTPPTTTAIPSGETYNSAQTVILTCDDGSGSGCYKTYYCLGTGCNPATEYTGPINISTSTDLRFYSTDLAGIPESVKTEEYIICPYPETPSTISYPSTDSDGTFTISWSAVLGATGYTLQQAKDSSFTTERVTLVDNLDVTSYDETGLDDGTYYYRVRAENSCGSSGWRTGGEIVVDSTVNKPSVTTGPAIVNKRSATLTGTVNPNGFETTVWFEWGETTAYGNMTTGQTIAGDLSDHDVEAEISGLKPNTTYHYRLVGENASGISYGADMTFTTPEKTIRYMPWIPLLLEE